ncbi:MAG: ribbon-helix-helix domain-containing protein [bacterium]
MANLQIKGIQDDLYERIKEMAASENRSVGQQVLYLIKEYLASKGASRSRKSPAQILLELSGSWEDTGDAEEIISDIKRGRRNSAKLREGF